MDDKFRTLFLTLDSDYVFLSVVVSKMLKRQFTLNTSCTQIIIHVSRIPNLFLFLKKVHFEAR